jgi:lipoyl(octanoyl) transferase
VCKGRIKKVTCSAQTEVWAVAASFEQPRCAAGTKLAACGRQPFPSRSGATIDVVISVVQLGRVDYASGLRLQQRLVDLRKAGEIADVLLLLEHTPVITLGRNAKAANVLLSPEQLALRGVEVFECDRGGDVTFHGPGQLVGYPILDLRGSENTRSQVSGVGCQEKPVRKTLGAVDYVRRLEEVLIRTCGDFGIPTRRVAGMTGVWTEPGLAAVSRAADDEKSRGPSTPPDDRFASRPAPLRMTESKIAAIGVHISRGVTSHGLALNVNTDLSYFDLIVPCGIASKPVTSMQKELGREVDFAAVAEAVSRNFGAVFASQMLWVETVEALLGHTVGVPMKVPEALRRLHEEGDQFV